MDKIQKFLEFLGKKERAVLVKILGDIRAGATHGYDVKPLQGHKGFFRLRRGKVRVVFAQAGQGGYVIVNVAYRKDAYKNF